MTDENDDLNTTGMVINASFSFNIIDQYGNDLLGSAADNAKGALYDYKSFKMYYLVDGKKVLVKDYDPGAADILLFKDEKPYAIGVNTDCYEKDGTILVDTNGSKTGVSIAYLELNEFDTDTIKTEWMSYTYEGDSHYSCFSVTKIWYNGELHLNNTGKPFSVVKRQNY